MANPPNVKLRKGPLPNETTVLFHGNPIGTVQKFEYDSMKLTARVRWYVHTFDNVRHEGWGCRLREHAVRRLVHLYMEQTGGRSTGHNLWVGRVKTRLEGSTK
jgi:hypothetical protein